MNTMNVSKLPRANPAGQYLISDLQLELVTPKRTPMWPVSAPANATDQFAW